MWIGVMSYGIYLFHYPLISYLEAHGVTRGPLPSLPSLFVVTLVISVAYGALSWYLVEKPFLNRFSSARARREA
jgi:peptidoglycan/LPS O-acetylase OafA/YrhL